VKLLVAVVLMTSACGRFGFDAVPARGDGAGDGKADADVFAETCFRGIASGKDNTCVIDARGDVWCWGSNNGFQTAPTQTGTDRIFVPAKVPLPRPAAQVALGDWVSCARLDDGTARCWGNDFRGALGDGAGDSSPGPVEPGLGDTIVDIAAGAVTVCALRASDRKVMCWGSNVLFEAATTGLSVDAPQPVAGTQGAKDLALAHHHGCIVDASDTVQCWGRGGSSELGTPAADQQNPRTLAGYGAASRVVRGGGRFTCVIEMNGDVRCNGLDDMMQLGRPDGFPSATPLAPIVSNVVDASLGSMSGCALLADHSVKCWGDGTDGILGPTNLRPSDTAVTVLANVNAMSSGAHHVCALKGAQVLCWGYNAYGQLGRGDASLRPSPAALMGIGSADQLSVGFEHACLRASNQLYCWGANYESQLGDGSRTGRPSVTHIDPGLSIEGVSAGGHDTCVWGGGFASCAGRADSGQTGDVTMPSRSLTFHTIPIISGVTYVDVGLEHACALNGGVVRCWGGNSEGELGDGSTTSTATPSTTNLGGATDVSAGHFATCAVAGAALSCWGNNANHEVSPTATNPILTPTNVDLAGDIPVQVSVGLKHVCAVTTTGVVKCWGGNDAGEVGNGTTTNVPSPIAIALPNTAAEVRCGYKLTCARLTDGRVYCWGLNDYGQLGNGTLGASATPVQVQNITDATSIDVGDGFACARHPTGTIDCWGNERRGRLASGRLTLDATPSPVALSCMP
jgi:alpha-tubulin suppressor-like RCC1 family protein